MRWDAVAQAIASRAAGDSVIAGIYGAEIRLGQAVSKFVFPALRYWFVDVGEEDELWAPHIVQFDQYTETVQAAADSERALARLFNHDRVQIIEGIYMWAFALEGAVDLTGPEREGFHGVASRYQFKPIREKLLR